MSSAEDVVGASETSRVHQTTGLNEHRTASARRVKVGPIVVEFPQRPSYTLEKRRAKEALAAFAGTRMDPLEAVEHLVTTYPDLAAGIDRVRVVKFPPNEEGPPTLQTWTKNDARLRQGLYDAAPAIAQETGWYLLVTGSFRWSLTGAAVALLRHASRDLESLDVELGEPLRLHDLTSARGRDLGNSFRLECASASIVMDLGFPGANVVPSTTDALLFVSHAHADHSGGLGQWLRHDRAIPILLTELTLSQLVRHMWRRFGVGPARRLVSRAVCIDVGRPIYTRDGARIECFHANHSPGAVMMLVTSPMGYRFLYTGDVALTNAYSEVAADAVRGSATISLPRHLDAALIDAVMVGRADEHQAKEAFQGAVERSVGKSRHLVVLADSPDIELRLYLQIYEIAMQGRAKRKSLKVYLDRETAALSVDLQRLARLHAGNTWLSRRVDPGIAKWWNLGKALFEAHQLFTVDERVEANVAFQLDAGDSIAMVLGPTEVAAASEGLGAALERVGRNADVVIVGGRHPDLGADFLRRQGLLRAGVRFVQMKGDILALDGLIWGLHSRETDLRRWLSGGLGQTINRSFLFHAPGRIIQRAPWLPNNAIAMPSQAVLRP